MCEEVGRRQSEAHIYPKKITKAKRIGDMA
jgi:hypothetical protein